VRRLSRAHAADAAASPPTKRRTAVTDAERQHDSGRICKGYAASSHAAGPVPRRVASAPRVVTVVVPSQPWSLRRSALGCVAPDGAVADGIDSDSDGRSEVSSPVVAPLHSHRSESTAHGYGGAWRTQGAGSAWRGSAAGPTLVGADCVAGGPGNASASGQRVQASRKELRRAIVAAQDACSRAASMHGAPPATASRPQSAQSAAGSMMAGDGRRPGAAAAVVRWCAARGVLRP
jgi:hypothetical protein